MDIIRSSELVKTTWKNGTGVMREIAAVFTGDESIFRISLADVSENVPFSDYTGQVRILTAIEGAGMSLDSDEGSLHARPFSPVRFSGALKIDAHLYAEASVNLNVMFDPETCDGDVMVLDGPQQPTLLEPTAGRFFAVYALAGTIPISSDAHLMPGDTVLISSDPLSLELNKGDKALVVRIDLNPGVDAVFSRI